MVTRRDLIDKSINQWTKLKQKFAVEMKLSVEEYEKEVSQWRDLWTEGGTLGN